MKSVLIQILQITIYIVIQKDYQVCDMSKMSEMSFLLSLYVMLSMSKIDQIHLRAVMLCMSKMSKMGKEHTDTFLS